MPKDETPTMDPTLSSIQIPSVISSKSKKSSDSDISVVVSNRREGAPRKRPKLKINIPDNTRRDLSFLQKKVSELEISVSQLNENMQKIDFSEIDVMKEKVSDIEDLTMVENAAVLELKKMLEGINTASDAIKAVEELTTRLSSVEEKVSVAPPPIDTTQMDELKNQLEGIKTGVESRISEIKSAAPDMETINNQIKHEMSMSSEWIRKEINSRIEQTYASFDKQIADVESKIPPSAEELNSLASNMSESLKSFKGSIETRFQTEQGKIDQKWANVENKMSSVGDLQKMIEELESDVETKRQDIENTVSRNEKIEFKIMKETSRLKDTNRKIEDLRVDLNGMKNYYDEVIDPIKDRVSEMENHTFDADGNLKNLSNRFEEIGRTMAQIESDMSVFQGSLMTFENKLSESGFTDIVMRVEDLEKDIVAMKSMEPDDKTNELLETVNKLEDRMNTMDSSGVDSHIAEIINRLVFLESRISAMESMAGARGYSAIIVE